MTENQNSARPMQRHHQQDRVSPFNFDQYVIPQRETTRTRSLKKPTLMLNTRSPEHFNASQLFQTFDCQEDQENSQFGVSHHLIKRDEKVNCMTPKVNRDRTPVKYYDFRAKNKKQAANQSIVTSKTSQQLAHTTATSIGVISANNFTEKRDQRQTKDRKTLKENAVTQSR